MEYLKAVYCHSVYLTLCREHHAKCQAGIKIARRNINNLRYADDTTLMEESKEKLKSLLMKVKEESEKVVLKLNIQKMKIMAYGSITSWLTEREKVETVTGVIFLGSRITVAIKLTDACSWNKSCDKPRQSIKKQRYHFAKKDLYSQRYSFSSSHVWIWELDHKESLSVDAFKFLCWWRLLRVPWTARELNKSILNEINPEYSLQGQILKLKPLDFRYLMQRSDSLEKTLVLAKVKVKLLVTQSCPALCK